VSAAACAPDVELAQERAARGAARPDAQAPSLELLAPLPGRQDVPPNLASLVLRDPGALPAPPPLVLRAGDGTTVLLAEPAGAPCPAQDGACYHAALAAPLVPGVLYALELGGGGVIAGFTTGASGDHVAPAVIDAAVTVSGDCVRVRATTDEPARSALVLRQQDGPPDQEETIVGPAGTTSFDFPARIVRLRAQAVAVVALWDLAGNRAEAGPVAVQLPPASPPLVITEVLANPAGPETTQEYVELRNLGESPVSLAGLALADDAGADALPPVEIAPGAYALVVAADFVAEGEGAKDPAPRAGTTLVPVAGRLGKDGLGPKEGVRLRAADGAVLSSYGAWVDAGASGWNGRSVHRRPDEAACDHPASWTRAPLPPTPGW
jgi:hypothetical protein